MPTNPSRHRHSLTPAAVHKAAKEKKTNDAGLCSYLINTMCRCYTLICVALLLIQALIQQSFTHGLIQNARFLCVLVFAMAWAAAESILRYTHWSNILQRILHYLLCIAGFYLGLYLPYQIEARPRGSWVVVVLFLFSLGYGLVCLVRFTIRRKCRRKQHAKCQEKETSYTNQFSGLQH